MERLHKAYAGTRWSSGDYGELAGLAVGCSKCLSQCLADGHLSPPVGQALRPISAIGSFAEDVLIQNWTNPVAPPGAPLFKGCFWIDHINKENFADFLAWVGNSKNEFSMVAWEPCFTDSPCTAELNRLQPNQGWELMAAALPRVVVMDERVQAEKGEMHRGIKLQDYWKGMQIEVPLEEGAGGNLLCNLENPDLNLCTDWLSKLGADADFLVVHLTVLEKLQSKVGGASSILEKLLEGAKIKKDAPIVVVTGRGAATFARTNMGELGEDLKKRIRQLPVSAILEYLVSRPSKLGLMRSLWSASQQGK